MTITSDLFNEQTIGAIATFAVLVMQAYQQHFAKKSAKQVTQKIDENTAVNVEALNVANGHNEKIAVVTEIATQTAVASMDTIMAALRENQREIAAIKATSEETRRLVECRLIQAPPAH